MADDIRSWINQLRSNDPIFTTLDYPDSENASSVCVGDGAAALAHFLSKNYKLKALVIYNARSHACLRVVVTDDDGVRHTVSIDDGAVVVAPMVVAKTDTLNRGVRGVESAIHLTRIDVKVLVSALRDHPSMESVHWGDDFAGSEGATALGNILKSPHSRIKELHLCGCRIGAAGLKSLVEACKCNVGTLKKLDLSDNQLTAGGIRQAFENCSAQDIKVKELGLSLNRIGSRGAIVVVNLLCRDKTVEVLSLDNCGIDGAAGKAIGGLLRVNTTLKKLILRRNQFGEEGLARIIRGLHFNSFLSTLDIRDTGCNDRTIHALVEVLKPNQSLTSLDLSWNKIRNAGAQFLAELLAESQTLAHLHLYGCEIGDEGFVAIARGLSQNNTMETIYLSNNECGLSGEKSICDVLKSGNCPIKELVMPLSVAGAEGVASVADLLKHNNSLESLDLSDSEISSGGAKVLSSGLRYNSGLKKLDLSFNEIGDEGVAAIINNALEEHNFVLEEIDMSNNDIDNGELLEKMELYLRWNKAGRRLLREQVPPALWPAVLAKTSTDLDVLYCFLLAKPDILAVRGS